MRNNPLEGFTADTEKSMRNNREGFIPQTEMRQSDRIKGQRVGLP